MDRNHSWHLRIDNGIVFIPISTVLVLIWRCEDGRLGGASDNNFRQMVSDTGQTWEQHRLGSGKVYECPLLRCPLRRGPRTSRSEDVRSTGRPLVAVRRHTAHLRENKTDQVSQILQFLSFYPPTLITCR